MGKLLCEKNLRDVWCRNESVRAEIGQILQTHTHTRVSYSSIDTFEIHSCQCPVFLTKQHNNFADVRSGCRTQVQPNIYNLH